MSIAPLSVGSQGKYPYVTNKVTHSVTQAVDYQLNPVIVSCLISKWIERREHEIAIRFGEAVVMLLIE